MIQRLAHDIGTHALFELDFLAAREALRIRNDLSMVVPTDRNDRIPQFVSAPKASTESEAISLACSFPDGYRVERQLQ